MQYLDFDLEIGTGSGGSYPVAVVRSPAGEARAVMRFPFDEAALQAYHETVETALVGSGQKRREAAQAVRDFGQQLFEALFTGDVRSRYAVGQNEAARQDDRGLRIKLRILAPELAALPWEFLYDAGQGKYVCLSRQTPLVRYLELPQLTQPLQVKSPLRILCMIASPSDQDQLDIPRERGRIQEALKDLEKRGLVNLTWLEGQTWRDLQRAMRGGPWHVFHFIGHGGFDPRSQEGVLALADEQGNTHLLTAGQMGDLLADHRSLRLALLNACEGALGSERDLFSSTAATLARQGIPAVLAMQYQITDPAAIECTRAFYESLADGLPVDAAVVEARKAISLGIANTLEWATPVLYMRSPDGLLFDLNEKPSSLAGAALDPDATLIPTPGSAAQEQTQSIQPPPAWLTLQGQRFLLSKAITTIGRSPENVITLNDPTVSRRHALILYQTERFLLQDTGSASGVYLNNRLLAGPTPLQQGDQIRIGQNTLTFWTEEPPAAPVQKGKPEGEKKQHPHKVSKMGTLVATYNGHDDWVMNLAWSPDGTLISSSQKFDRFVHLWEVETGAHLSTYEGHSDSIHAAVWSPADGKYIASASEDGTVQVWESESLALRFPAYRGHQKGVYAAAWSPDGKRVASGGNDGTVQVWSATRGGLIAAYRGHASSVGTLAWSPDGTKIVSGSSDNSAHVWDAASGDQLFVFDRHEDTVYAVSWSPDGKHIASAGGDGTIQVWAPEPRGKVESIGDGEQLVLSIAWSPAGGRIAVASDEKVLILDAENLETVVYNYTRHKDTVRAVVWSPDGKRVASASNDGTAQVWEAE